MLLIWSHLQQFSKIVSPSNRPLRLNKPLALERGASFRFHVQVADRDNSDARHELSLTPGGDEADGIKVLLIE